MGKVIHISRWLEKREKPTATATTLDAHRVVLLSTSAGVERWLTPWGARRLAEALQEARVRPYFDEVHGIEVIGNGQTVSVIARDKAVTLTNPQCAQLCVELGASARKLEGMVKRG